METDRYGLEISTSSSDAAAAYRTGVDLFLSANPGADEAFARAIAADRSFALAHAGLARFHQVRGDAARARGAMGEAERCAATAGRRERQHVAMLALLVGGRPADALAAARAHLRDHPRDAMVLAPCASTFGLIAFSGRPQREAELASLLDALAADYGDDWWFLGVHAFALVESGRLREGRPMLERAQTLHPRNGNAAHFYAHLLYEENEPAQGLAFLEEWLKPYPREATLHCHLHWHRALWLHEAGRHDEAWAVYCTHVRPGASWGPPLNVLTDAASFLWRSELAGHPRDRDEWRHVAHYVPAVSRQPGLAFADVHATLAFAAAGDRGRFDGWQAKLRELVAEGQLPAGDVVPALGDAWMAFADEDWESAARLLQPLVAEHERIGGSRAQRDLIEHTLAHALLRSGRPYEEALRAVRPRLRPSYA